MKIDQDLRAAIRSAEKTQLHYGWEEREKEEIDSINAFLAKHSGAAKHVRKLRADYIRHYKAFDLAREQLCKTYGLKLTGDNNVLRFAGCDSAQQHFVDAGGKVPTKKQHWKFDVVMSELAAAESKDANRILRKYGINWK